MIQALAPMDGITDMVYRSIVNNVFTRYNKNPSNTLRTRTEFMNADGYMIQPHKLVKHLIHHDQEQQLIAQIYWGNEETLIKTAVDIEKKYPSFYGIELNIGCPSPKVIACGGGSGMMQDKAYTIDVIKNIAQAINKPFSIKVRTGLNDSDKKERFKALLKVSPYLHCISVHGRTYKQWHSGEVDWGFIYQLKKELWNSCLIIGNGGIISYQDSQNHLQNLDGIMIAQAAIADPRLFTTHKPTISDRYEICKKHLSLTIAHEIRYYRTVQNHTTLEHITREIEKNREYVHALKQYDENNDHRTNNIKLEQHKYQFPMPKRDDINSIAENINSSTSPKERTWLHGPIQFRKFLFNYIKGLPWNKEFKQQVANIYEPEELQDKIDLFFHVLT